MREQMVTLGCFRWRLMAIRRFGEAMKKRARGSFYAVRECGPSRQLFPANGRVVALSGDTALVKFGATTRSFTRSGTQWTEQAPLTPSDGAGTSYMALQGDTAVIGSTGAHAAYVFSRSGGIWSEQEKLTSGEDAVGSNFGSAVAISGDSVLVGDTPNASTGSAYVFVRTGASWSKQQKFASPVADTRRRVRFACRGQRGYRAGGCSNGGQPFPQ